MNINDFEEIIINKKLSNLGVGSQGIVLPMKHKKTNKIYAVKIIKKDRLRHYELDILKREIFIHKFFNHPNIIKFYFSINTDEKLYLFLEYAENKDLFRYLGENELNENMLKKIFLQVCLGIKEIHDKNVIHRDIKPENILLDKNLNVKICDFGWSAQIYENTKRDTFCGTYEYMSPEIIFSKQQTKKSDIWSLGILLYEIYHKKAPFEAKSFDQIKNIFLNKNISIKFKKSLDKEIKDLILKILQLNINKRPNIDEILNSNFLSVFKKKTIKSNKRIFEKKNINKNQNKSNSIKKNNFFECYKKLDSNYNTIRENNSTDLKEKNKYPIYSLLKTNKKIKFIL